MDFLLSDEQIMFKDVTDRVVARQQSKGAADLQWKDLVELGWPGLLISERHGGVGGSLFDATIAAAGQGAALINSPFIATSVIAAGLIEKFGSSAQQGKWLGEIANGQLLVACPVNNPTKMPAVIHPIQEGKTYQLSGETPPMLVFAGMQMLLLPVVIDDIVTAGRWGIAAIEPAALGLVPLAETMLADGRKLARYRLDAVRIASSSLLLNGNGDALEAIADCFDRAMVVLCADAVGAMQSATKLAGDYLQIRKQFGVPLASFQSLRHRLVDMEIEKSLAETMLQAAAMACDEAVSDRRRIVRMAVVRVGQAGRIVGDAAVQMHGGIGVSAEHAIGQFYKRLLVDDILCGGATGALAELAESITVAHPPFI